MVRVRRHPVSGLPPDRHLEESRALDTSQLSLLGREQLSPGPSASTVGVGG